MAAPYAPQTMVDRELADMPRGAELTDAVAKQRGARAVTPLGPTMQPLSLGSTALSLTWGDLCQRNPDWDADYWAECRALYAGGKRLLGDPQVFKRLFPQNLFEEPHLYAARRARAHYFPYAGTIIDHLLAGLGTDQLAISFTQVDDQGVAQEPDEAAKWWQHWVGDVTDEAERPADYGLESENDEEGDDEGGRTMHRFCVDVLREALQTRCAWVLADLPSDDEPGAAQGKEDEGLDPYLCLIPAERVVDWQCDEKGRLVWAMVQTCEQIRATPKDRRGVVRHTYVLWDAHSWVKYIVDVDPAQSPHPDTTYQPIDGAPHAFGRVPLERLELPEGMYAMGKLHSLAREHFNKRNAMGWAEFRSLFAQLYEFLGPSDGSQSGSDIPEIQSDANRSTNQVRSVGHTQVRGKDDDVRYIGPSTESFTAARESCNDAMREMHRVMFSMALSANMDSAALSRSGESKKEDGASVEVILNALSALIRPFVRRLFVLASLGRGEAVPWCHVTGLEHFDAAGIEASIQQAVDVFNGLPQKSARFAELYLTKIYGQVLGDVSQEDMELIQEQVREAQSQEELQAEQDAMGMGDEEEAEEGDDGEDPDDAELADLEAQDADDESTVWDLD